MLDIGQKIIDAIAHLFDEMLYYIGTFLTRVISVLYDIFRVFSGTEKVSYNGTDDYLINLFVSNQSVNRIYGGIALIGVAICIGFTVAAVIKKMADVDDKMHTSLGGILRKTLTSVITIFLVHFILIGSIKFSNLLMSQIEYLFINAESLEETTEITFSDEDYATMARICDTVGNYSLNDSANSRYNINNCYNEIRSDMIHLQDRGLFNFTYDVKDESGERIVSIPYLLSQLARARNLSEPMVLKNYDASVSSSMLELMDYLTANAQNIELQRTYYREVTTFSADNMDLGVVLFLSATTDAAKDTNYNGNTASYSDPIRSAYVNGSKSIYNIDDVEKDFDLSIHAFAHFLLIIGCLILGREFIMIIIDCVARILNLMLLYLAAPPFIASSPLDEGAKFKQWGIAFVVQCFNVFGTVVALRLFMLFCPMIFDSNLVILNGGFVGTLAKFLLIVGAVYGARKGSGIISGILADSAGWQSVNAGDASSGARHGVFGRMFDRAKGKLNNEMWGLAYSGTKQTLGAVLKSPFTIGSAVVGGISNAKHTRENERNMNNFNSSMNALKASNPEKALGRARDFLGMSKEDAKSVFGINDEQYTNTRNAMSQYVIDQTWGRNGGQNGNRDNNPVAPQQEHNQLDQLLAQAGADAQGNLLNGVNIPGQMPQDAPMQPLGEHIAGEAGNLAPNHVNNLMQNNLNNNVDEPQMPVNGNIVNNNLNNHNNNHNNNNNGQQRGRVGQMPGVVMQQPPQLVNHNNNRNA